MSAIARPVAMIVVVAVIMVVVVVERVAPVGERIGVGRPCLGAGGHFVVGEQARIELLRTAGVSYKDLEDQGYLMVLTKVEVQYKRPARYDDLLTIRATVARTTMVRIDHRYQVLRGAELLAEGSSTLACVDREGRPQALPEFLQSK